MHTYMQTCIYCILLFSFFVDLMRAHAHTHTRTPQGPPPGQPTPPPPPPPPPPATTDTLSNGQALNAGGSLTSRDTRFRLQVCCCCCCLCFLASGHSEEGHNMDKFYKAIKIMCKLYVCMWEREELFCSPLLGFAALFGSSNHCLNRRFNSTAIWWWYVSAVATLCGPLIPVGLRRIF
jgi:hypothetical protein